MTPRDTNHIRRGLCCISLLSGCQPSVVLPTALNSIFASLILLCATSSVTLRSASAAPYLVEATFANGGISGIFGGTLMGQFDLDPANGALGAYNLEAIDPVPGDSDYQPIIWSGSSPAGQSGLDSAGQFLIDFGQSLYTVPGGGQYLVDLTLLLPTSSMVGYAGGTMISVDASGFGTTWVGLVNPSPTLVSGTVTPSPEPATFTLSGLALLLFGGSLRWQRRRIALKWRGRHQCRH